MLAVTGRLIFLDGRGCLRVSRRVHGNKQEVRHVGERSVLHALIPPSGRGRRGVGHLVWLLCVFVSLASVTSARPEAAPQLVLDWRGGRLSVSAHAAPWEEVFRELERHTGIQLLVQGSLAGTLTQAFEALSLEQGLRRLFRDVNTVFFYATGSGVGPATAPLTQVWLIPRDEGSAARPLPFSLGSAATVPQGASNPLRDSAARSVRQEEVPPAGKEEEEEEEEMVAERR
jgi:hypothetical protein